MTDSKQLSLFGDTPAPAKKPAKKKSKGFTQPTAPAEPKPRKTRRAKKKPAPDPESAREPTEAERRPFVATARDAQAILSRGDGPTDYLGIMRADEKIVCRSCLDARGAVHSLDGAKFLHYLWHARERHESDVSGCAFCGVLVTFERI